jgi:hypothetical protein
MPTERVPSSWTRPLQTGVITCFAISGIDAITIPFWNTSVGRGTAVGASLLGVALTAVVIVGALRRWVWLYNLIWVFLGAGTLVTLLNVVQGSFFVTYGTVLPRWAGWVSLALTTIGGVLAVVMLYARHQRGPWGMTSRRVGLPNPESEETGQLS